MLRISFKSSSIACLATGCELLPVLHKLLSTNRSGYCKPGMHLGELGRSTTQHRHAEGQGNLAQVQAAQEKFKLFPWSGWWIVIGQVIGKLYSGTRAIFFTRAK